MLNRVYCTYFDHNYLPRGLALYHSLQRNSPDAPLWVLCLSEACHQVLSEMGLPNLIPIRLADFEDANPDVAATRPTRSVIEYYFTCSPAWMLFVLDNAPDAEWVTYLDSDLFFFAPPDPIYDEMNDDSLGIIPHRFSKGLEFLLRYGFYNVGWVSVRRRDNGIAALRWWRERCIEWCYDHVEDDRFADQRYLDRFPEMFSGVHTIEHLGANLAPWNLTNVRLELRNETLEVNRRYPLMFFHFHGIRRSGEYYFTSHRLYNAPFSGLMRDKLYKPYLAALAEAELAVTFHLKHQLPSTIRKPVATAVRDRIPNGLRKARVVVNRGLDIITGRAIPVRDILGR